MAGLNKAQVLGRLGQDPQINQTTSGKKFANFSIATSESYKDKDGERVEKTQWHNCTAWSPLAEIIEKYVKKGSELYVEGKMETQDFEGKDGVQNKTTKIIVNNLVLVGGKSEGGAPSQPRAQTPASQPQSAQVSDDGDELPF